MSGAVVNGSQPNNGNNSGSQNGAGSGVKIAVSGSLLPLAIMVLLGLQLVLPAATVAMG